MKFWVILFLILLFSYAAIAQQLISGKIINAKTKEPLPFVNITIKGKFQGTTSDLDGRFQLQTEDNALLLFSYVGYTPLETPVQKLNQRFAIISLSEKTTELKEIVIRPENNPAWKIIGKAVANKSINDPENLSSFSYRSYNKLYATTGNIDSPLHHHKKVKDTVALRKFLDGNHLFIIESTTERYFRQPNFSKEIVLGNRMTGVKDPFFSFLATDFQPFSFYKDFIPLFEKSYLNPVSKGFEDRYDFTMEDSIHHSRDTTFIISFEPLPGKKFEGLKGQLYISSDGYAIEHVIAEPVDDVALITPRIQQEYKKMDGHWFPIQLHSELRFREYQVFGRNLKYVSRSYFSQVKINPEIKTKKFDRVQVEFDALANKRDESFWIQNRLDSLSKKEIHTFKVYDSISAKTNALNSVFKILEGVVVGKFKVGHFYLPIENLMKVNQYEGVRFGLGIQSGETISKVFSLHAFGGYGVKDRGIKYGSAFKINLPDRKQTSFSVSYRQDLSEPGTSYFLKNLIPGTETVRNWLTSRMDSVKEWRASITSHPLLFSTLEFFASQELRNPTYAYQYALANDLSPHPIFKFATVGGQFRYAHKESYTQIRNTNVVTNLAYPQVNVSFLHGLKDRFGGQFDFTRVEMKIDHQFQMKGLGKTTFEIGAGMVQGNVPYPYLFNGKGINAPGSFGQGVVVNNYFQTMDLYEFLSDRYFNVFLTHHLGKLTGTGSKYFRPELSLVHNLGYGSLKNPTDHTGIAFRTMNKGFFEGGAIVTNLIRFNYQNIFYLGIGGGIFYRYGAYSSSHTSDNFAYKLVLSAGF